MNSIDISDCRITLESSGKVGAAYLIIDDMSEGGKTVLALFVDRITINEGGLKCDHKGHDPIVEIYPKRPKKPKLYKSGQEMRFLHRCPACGQTQWT